MPKKYAYASLNETVRSYMRGWVFNNDSSAVYHESLLSILNTLGQDGWQLVSKEEDDGGFGRYILMRELT